MLIGIITIPTEEIRLPTLLLSFIQSIIITIIRICMTIIKGSIVTPKNVNHINHTNDKNMNDNTENNHEHHNKHNNKPNRTPKGTK